MVTKVTLTHPDTDQVRIVAEQNVPEMEALGWAAEKVEAVEPEEPKAQVSPKRAGSSNRGKATAKPSTTKQEK